VRPQELPSVPFDEVESLPDRSGVYFAISTEGEILYIGRAKSLLLRWRAHHRAGQLKAIGRVRVAWLLCGLNQYRELERQFIDQWQPRLNWSDSKGNRCPSSTTVAFRVPLELRDFYQSIADRERRTLSQVLLIALEDFRSKAKKKAA